LKTLSVSIIHSLNRQDREIEIPELVQEPAQGSLVGKLADQQRLAIFLWNYGDVTEPIGDRVIQYPFEPDPISCHFTFPCLSPVIWFFSFKSRINHRA
jgi:hypothetical protein